MGTSLLKISIVELSGACMGPLVQPRGTRGGPPQAALGEGGTRTTKNY
jgi:hypothetical protein